MKKILFIAALLIYSSAASFYIGRSSSAEQSAVAEAACVENDAAEQVVIEDEFNWDNFILAVAWIESRWDPSAVGTKDDVGYLQITPILVEDVNRINRINGVSARYTLDDRYSQRKSEEMFLIIQNHYNKEHDLKKACKLWNPGAPAVYTRRILEKNNEICNEQFNKI